MRLFTIVLALNLVPLTAGAVTCVEYFEQSGRTALFPNAEELSPAEVTALVAQARKSGAKVRVVSAKPRLSLKNDVMIATFPNQPAEPFQVFGIQGPRGYLRPDLPEVQGFMARQKTVAAEADQASEAAQTELATKAGALKTRNRAIVYGTVDDFRVISLETNEVISAMVNLGTNERLVVTARADQKIGFFSNPADAKRNFQIEAYVNEPTGHTFIGFRVPAGKSAYPKVDVVEIEGTGLLLTLDDQTFVLKLEKNPNAGDAAAPRPTHVR
jgi:hypothetical protein